MAKFFSQCCHFPMKKKIIKEAKKNFKSVKKLSHHEWLLPSEMKKKNKNFNRPQEKRPHLF